MIQFDRIKPIVTMSSTEPSSLALLVEYNGSAFSGSQSQGVGALMPTVQQAVMQAFEALGLADVVFSSHFASRTDAGVHALGQVMQVRCSVEAIAQRVPDLCLALNAKLPESIAIRAVEYRVSEQFNCQHSAKQRWYRYQWFLSKYRSVFTPFNAVREHRSLDVVAMQEAVGSLVGSHCFKTFQSPSVYKTSADCTLTQAVISQPTPSTVLFDVIANRFVYKMVRNLAAALWQIGLNPRHYPPQSLLQRLQASNRACSPKSAPARGLTLMSIAYPSPDVHEFSARPLFWADSLTQLLNRTLMKEFSHDENIFCQV
jgi:tRNA pseudouridine38-40 synthase